jgi:hypothetical protein
MTNLDLLSNSFLSLVAINSFGDQIETKESWEILAKFTFSIFLEITIMI